MGTFSKHRNEYDNPPIPVPYAGRRNITKAFLRGWTRGIWHERPLGYWGRVYRNASQQAAFERGYRMAHLARRERGEQGLEA